MQWLPRANFSRLREILVESLAASSSDVGHVAVQVHLQLLLVHDVAGLFVEVRGVLSTGLLDYVYAVDVQVYVELHVLLRFRLQLIAFFRVSADPVGRPCHLVPSVGDAMVQDGFDMLQAAVV